MTHALAHAGHDVPNLPEWDDELRDRYEEQWRSDSKRELEAMVRRGEQEASEWRVAYEEHLRSPKWAALRRKVMQRCGGRCEGCADAQAVHVHHLHYKNLGDELLWELVGVCLDCHQRVHPHREIA